MDRAFTISGLHCNACVARVTKALKPFAREVQVTLEPPRAVLRQIDADASLEVLNIAAAGAGKYTLEIEDNSALAHDKTDVFEKSWFGVYAPLLLIFAFLLGVTGLIHVRFPGRAWHEWMNDVMAGFFLVFSFFKLLNLNGFASAYQSYDVLAAKSRVYALAYPFIELALGIAYLLRWNPMLVHIVTLVLMLVSALGVLNALRKRQLIECACLGTVFKLPMSKVTLIEDLSMAVMAAIMLWVM